MMPQFHFRPGTLDEAIFRDVVGNNEYQLPDEFQADDIIIDIGAHIGSFSYACLIRGALKVYAVEAVKENYELLQANLAQWGNRVESIWAAAWRSDAGEEESRAYSEFSWADGILNTAGASVVFDVGSYRVPTIAFDKIVGIASEGYLRPIRLLKVDAEGSEWPILFTSRYLHLMQEICGEFHEIGGEYDHHALPFQIRGYERYTIQELTRFLSQQGFDVRHQRSIQSNGVPSHMGLFFAQRI